MEAQVALGGPEKLPVGSGEEGRRTATRLVLLAINERVGISAVPLLRGQFNYNGRGTSSQAARQIATAIKEGRPMARDNRTNVQAALHPNLYEVLARHWEGVEWESPGL